MVVSLREDITNLACKLRHLVVHVRAWLSSLSYGHVMAWCDVVLLCWPWRYYRHDDGLSAVPCNVVSAVIFVITSWFSRGRTGVGSCP
jgi:hypothetical protein